MTNDFMLDVDEAMRQEKLDKFWKEYGSTIILAIVLTIVLTAGSSAWRSYNTKVNEKATSKILVSLDSETPAEKLEGVSVSRPGHVVLAQFSAASAYLSNGQVEEAYSIYNGLSQNSDLSDFYRQLATLLSVKSAHSMNNELFEPYEAMAKLNSIIADQDSSWRYHASIEKAVLLSETKQDYQSAIESLQVVLKDESIPQTLVQRAAALEHVYKINVSKTPKSASTDTAGKQSQTDSAE